ncbi:MAG: hypothetical protein K6U09_12015 [Acidobacteriia bacterium]|jgi:hypothetical protein|nr:hypothetical protein [Terriglobia bacterium]
MTMHRPKWRRNAWLVAAATVLLVQGFAWLLERGWLHAPLERRLAVAFGRPVAVQSFSVGLFGGLRLQANQITVGEDPAFGPEHFLRAEQLAAGLRWTALLAGRLEFDTLVLKRPSLNLVRNPDSHWNLESWLPPAAGGRGTPRFSRLVVEEGRINFKRGPDKLSVALRNVSGSVTAQSGGRWQVELEAELFRGGVTLQQPGTLRLRGVLSSTSTRLQPASVELTWRDASLADALRFVAGRDFGVRGSLEADLHARSERATPGWTLRLSARLRSLHRWDLPPRAGDPRLDLSAEALWLPTASRLEFSRMRLDAPQSNLFGAGWLQWTAPADSEFHLDSEGLSWNDLLAWLRAFRPGVDEAAVLEGAATARFRLSGWPPRIVQGELATAGARLRAPKLPQPLGLAAATVQFAPDRIELRPTQLSFPREGARLRLAGEAVRSSRNGWHVDLRLSGVLARSEQLLPAAEALGWGLAGWWARTFQPRGAARVNLRWRGAPSVLAAIPAGTVELSGLALQPDVVSQPVVVERGRIELQPKTDGLRVQIASAQALGTSWSGTLTRAAAGSWSFSLHARHLDVAVLDRWLGPRARRGLLARVLPTIGRGRPSEAAEWLAGLRAAGELRADALLIAPFELENLVARMEIAPAPRTLRLADARAQFAGGRVQGSMEAVFDPDPAYRVEAEFADVHLRRLVRFSPALREKFSGQADGHLIVQARGVGRDALLDSLRGSGAARIAEAGIAGLDLQETVLRGEPVAGTTRLLRAEGTFRLHGRRVELEDFRASDPRGEYRISGNVDFARQADLHIEWLGAPWLAHAAAPAEAETMAPQPVVTRRQLRLFGPLEALRVAGVAAEPSRPDR